MRILHLLASPWWSGPAECVAALALAQRELGHQVTVAVDRKRAGGGAEEPSVPRLRALGLLDEGGLELSVKSTPKALFRDLRALSRRPVDVVHAHFTHDHLLAQLARPKGALRVRSLHAPRSVRWSLPPAHAYTVAFSGMEAALGRGPCLTLPAPVDARFAPSPSVEALRARLGLQGAPLVGMASTFQPSRRHALALDAFARRLLDHSPNAHLVLLGDGALEPSLRARAASPDLRGRVTFAGYVRGEDYLGYLQALDELWVLGLGNDWSARVAAQARACGVRVVAVGEGALPAYADAVIAAPTVAAVVEASIRGDRRPAQVFGPREVALAVEDLYLRAGAKGARP